MIARWASASPASGSSARARSIAASASSVRPTFSSTPATVGMVARIARRFGDGVERVQRAGVVVGGHELDRGLQPGRQPGGQVRRRPASSVRIGG